MIKLYAVTIYYNYRVRFVLIVPAREDSQLYQPFLGVSCTDQSNNTQIMTGNNNDSITIIFMITTDLTGLS